MLQAASSWGHQDMQEFLKKEGMVRMVNDIGDAGDGQPSTTGEYAIGIGTDGEPNRNVAFHGVPMPHILGQPARSVNLGKVVYSIYQTMVYASPQPQTLLWFGNQAMSMGQACRRSLCLAMIITFSQGVSLGDFLLITLFHLIKIYPTYYQLVATS